MSSSTQLKWYSTIEAYSENSKDVSIFFKVKENFGGLSNMSNDFPIQVNGYKIANTEALYQACRFPDYPDIQEEILKQRSGIAAKMKSKKYRKEFTRVDWDDVRVDIMRFCLQLKLEQNRSEFGALLESTGNTLIVERSSKDSFWGAVWGPVWYENYDAYVGQNVLGKLLTELRGQYRNRPTPFVKVEEQYQFVEIPNIVNFKLLGQNII